MNVTRRSTYVPQEIEPKWQKIWVERGVMKASDKSPKPKYYDLVMYPYPSGDMTVGHARNYVMGDVLARMKRMQGFEVLHPFGWDAFGLPAENAAMKRNVHPQAWTLANIENGKRELKMLGILYDWDREVTSRMPDYYRWTQWLFLLFYERGLAYRAMSPVNWCPVDKPLLAASRRGGREARPRAMVLQDHRLRRAPAGRPAAAGQVAAQGAVDADELDRPQRRRRGRFRRGWARGGVDPHLHDATRHAVRGHVHGARARAPVGGEGHHRRQSRSHARVRSHGAQGERDRPPVDRAREDRGSDRGLRHQPPQRREDPHLDRRIRAHYLWHGGDHGRAGTRRARLRVCQEVQPADPRGHRAGRGRRRRFECRLCRTGRDGQQRPVRRPRQ